MSKKNQKGVTIIALVVTIVVLLIIASITISTLNGDNGIIESATDSHIKTELSQLKQTLNSYKAEGEANRIKEGDYSGELTNKDLEEAGIIRKVITVINLDNAQFGIINLKALNVNSQLGNNQQNINVDSVNSITELYDVFAINIYTNEIYYIREKVWSINGEVNPNNLEEKDPSNAKLKISANPTSSQGTEGQEEIDVIINIENKNKLSDKNKYEFYLSKSERTLEGSQFKNYESGTKNTIGKNKNGTYYLLIREIEDDNGNKSIGGEKVLISGERYHKFGPYVFNSNIEKQITATFDANGGSQANPVTIKRTYGEQLGTLPTTSRVGYTFDGWWTEAIRGTKIENTTTMPAENVTYYAHWTINNYTVTYDNNYYANNLMPNTIDPSTYKAWRTTTTGSTITDASVTNGKIVKLVFGEVTGTQNGVQSYEAGTLTIGKTYTYSIYLKSSSNRTMRIGPQQGGIININVTTSWQKFTYTFVATEASYTSFVLYGVGESNRFNEGDELYIHSLELMEGTPTHTTQTKTYGNTLGTLPTPTRTGYTLSGWYTAPTGGTKISSTTAVPASNTTYYAHWTFNTYTVTYNYSENGGKSATKTSASLNYGNAVDLTPTAVKEGDTGTYSTSNPDGWKFVGWNTNKDATTALTSYSMPASNTTLYAIYSKTIKATCYYYDGSKQTSKAPSSTVYNKTTSASINLGTVSLSGYTFRGWSTSNAADATIGIKANASATISTDTTYYASYSKTVTATFYYHGGTDQYASTQTSTTAKGTQYKNSAGSVKNNNISIPSAVSSSTGYYGTKYKGVSASKSSTTATTPTTATTAYYAYYQVNVTLYYWNGSAHTSKVVVRNGTTNGTSYSASAASAVPTPSAYDGAAYKGWTYNATSVTSDYVRTFTNTAATTLYAYYQKTITITHNVNGGSGTIANSTGTKTYISKSGGVNTYNPSIKVTSTKPSKNYSVFQNWNTKADGTGTNYSSGATVTTGANMTLYAIYRQQYAYVTGIYEGNVLYINSTPAAGNVIGRLHNNDQVWIHGESGDWWYVYAHSRIYDSDAYDTWMYGWVYKGYITTPQ